MDNVLEQTKEIYITEQAASVVKQLLIQKNVPGYGLRVFVSGGGCSGMQYGMALEKEARPYDNVIEEGGIRVFIDPTSMMYLEGATIGYEDTLMGGGFKIENPQAVSSCGCGHSFKTKESSAASTGAGCGSCSH